MRHYGLLFLGTLGLAATVTAGGVQGQSAAQTPKTPAALAAFADREWVRPVLDTLSRRRDLDPELRTLLDRVQLWTLPEPRPQWGPNAIALNDAGRPTIYIDLVFVNYINTLADLVALALTGRDEAGAILFKVGEEYGKALAARRAGSRVPDVFFDRTRYLTDPLLAMVVNYLSNQVMVGVVAWAVLHEIAHHRLGHLYCRDVAKPETCVRPKTLAESRSWELDADAWAFKTLDSLGYGLYVVDGFLIVNSIFETVRTLAGAAVPEGSSTHPSFETRQKQLAKLHTPEKPPLRDVMVFMSVSEPAPGRFVTTETTVFRDPWTTGWLLANQTGAGGVLLPFEWRGNTVHLFGRDQSRINEFIIHDAQTLKPRTTYRETLIASGLKSEVPGIAIRVDAGWMQNLVYRGIPVSTLLETSPRRLVATALRSVGASPLAAGEVEAIHVEGWRAASQLMIDYCRGRISADRATMMYRQIGEDGQSRVRQVLGPERYARWADAVLTNPVMSIGLDEVMKRVKRP